MKTSPEEVTTLTTQAVLDYTVCEFFYKCRYIEEEHELIIGREHMIKNFESTLKKVATYFFHKKQGDPPYPSYNALLNRWEKLWFPKDMTAYDMMVEQHESAHGNHASFSNVAVASLEAFHDYFEEDRSTPVLIDEPFIIQLEDNVRLEGQFDLVLKNERNQYTVVKWSGRKGKPRVDTLLLDFALLKLAWETRGDKYRPTRYALYDLASTKKGYEKIDQPTTVDIDSLRYWTLEAANSENYVPRRGYTAYCKGCPFDKQCLNFEGWPTS